MKIAALTGQNQTLYAYLRSGHSITTLEAMQKFGICRLSERVREIESYLGSPLIHKPIKQNGKRFMRYSLPREKPMQGRINENGILDFGHGEMIPASLYK